MKLMEFMTAKTEKLDHGDAKRFEKLWTSVGGVDRASWPSFNAIWFTHTRTRKHTQWNSSSSINDRLGVAERPNLWKTQTSRQKFLRRTAQIVFFFHFSVWFLFLLHFSAICCSVTLVFPSFTVFVLVRMLSIDFLVLSFTEFRNF